ncbi:MAG: hypothetical protein EA351_01385 [Gemmatimonadales bacterium]|nr:MAG: hypothetical protein EA351_01385 [Gemmatimonadales bacterium]
MLIIALLSLITAHPAPQHPDTVTCGEVCEAVLAEGLDWAMEMIHRDSWDRWADVPRRFSLNLHMPPGGRIYRSSRSYFERRRAENEVLRELAARRDIPTSIEEHPFAPCHDTPDQARDEEACRALAGSFSFGLYDVDIVGPTEATVRAGISIRPVSIGWILHVEKVEDEWEVVNAHRFMTGRIGD